MKITKNQKRLFIILGLVLGYAVFDIILNIDQYKMMYFGSVKSSTKPANELVKPKFPMTGSSNKKHVELDWKRNPFKGKTQGKYLINIEVSKSNKRLILQAITYSFENSMVIINGRILQEGDEIDGYKIIKIYRNKVELTKYGQSIFIHPN